MRAMDVVKRAVRALAARIGLRRLRVKHRRIGLPLQSRTPTTARGSSVSTAAASTASATATASLCDVSVSRFRKRMKAEGWTEKDEG